MSIGRYVLSGGELAAMVACDAILRKLPGALGHEESAVEESFSRRARGQPRVPALHAARRVPRLEGPRGAAERPPRRDRQLAAARSRERGRAAGLRYHDPPFATLVPSRYGTVIDTLERAQLRRVPRFQAGDRVRVHFQVIEGTRRRTQVFEGVVIKRQGHGARETFTVRKQSFGVGVERTFPVHSPKIEKIDVAARGDVRRAKLYYLRERVGKRARVRERRYIGPEEIVEPGLLQRPRRAARGRGRRRDRRPSTPRAPSPRRPSAAEGGADTARRGRGRRRRRADRRARGRPRRASGGEAPEADEPADEPTPTPRRQVADQGRSRRASSLVELVVIVAVALGLALGIQAFLVKPYRIPSESMVPTLEINQRVLVNRIGNNFTDPEVGEVMVFHPPSGADDQRRCGVRGHRERSCARGRRRQQGRRELHQARRRRAGRPARASVNGRVDPSTASRSTSRTSGRARPGAGLRLPRRRSRSRRTTAS